MIRHNSACGLKPAAECHHLSLEETAMCCTGADWACVTGREKELAKALAAQEKEVLRMRQREAQTGPRDDLDPEWQALLDEQRLSIE